MYIIVHVLHIHVNDLKGIHKTAILNVLATGICLVIVIWELTISSFVKIYNLRDRCCTLVRAKSANFDFNLL